MDHTFKKALAHIYWIGGPANSGKTTIAKIIARKKRYDRYSYDKHAMDHFERLAVASGSYQFLPTESQEDSWANVMSGAIVRQTLKVFENRFPLAIEDLLEITTHRPILAEGIGFTPELLSPFLSSPSQAIWLIPEAQFMERSLRQKVKTHQTHLMKQSHKAIEALIYRDLQMVEVVTAQVQAYHLKMVVIDGTTPKKEVAEQVIAHFSQYSS